MVGMDHPLFQQLRLCLMTNERANALALPLMTEDNKDSLRTAYTISVDAASQSSTGISATDRVLRPVLRR